MSKMAVYEENMKKLRPSPGMAQAAEVTLSTHAGVEYSDHAPRYLFFAGFGDYTDELEQDTGALIARGFDGGRYVGYNVFPSRTLIPVVDTPVIDYVRHRPGEYDTTKPHQIEKEVNGTFVRTAKECAYDITAHFKQFGFVNLVSLINLDKDQAHSVFTTIVPFDFAPYVKYTTNKEGLILHGEINEYGTLTNLREYLRQEGENNLRSCKLTGDLKKRAKVLLSELIEATNFAYIYENGVYQRTVAELDARKQTGFGKPGPDTRDDRFARDLHLPQISRIQAETVAAYGEKAGDASAKAIEKLGETLANNQQAVAATGVISPEVQAILDRYDQTMQMMLQIVQQQQSVPPAPAVVAAPVEAKASSKAK